jgi:HPt (histidine-containing phosphotransfer) domain-containing protein
MNNTDATDKFTVEIDNVLSPIVPEFLSNRRDDCALIHQLVSEGNFSEIRRMGHRMKGTGGSYGFDEISEIGEAVEEASLAADGETILNQIQRLSDYLDRVSVVYV